MNRPPDTGPDSQVPGYWQFAVAGALFFLLQSVASVQIAATERGSRSMALDVSWTALSGLAGALGGVTLRGLQRLRQCGGFAQYARWALATTVSVLILVSGDFRSAGSGSEVIAMARLPLFLGLTGGLALWSVARYLKISW